MTVGKTEHRDQSKSEPDVPIAVPKEIESLKLMSSVEVIESGFFPERYVAYDLSETSYADASSVANDTVMQQAELSYDNASNQTTQVSRDRFHDATGTGELTNPNGAQPKARVSYLAFWPDPQGRQIATADYGTNGAEAWTRPATIPERSDLVLVNSTEYNDRGEVVATVDPNGIVTKQQYDDAGRLVLKIENYVEESV